MNQPDDPRQRTIKAGCLAAFERRILDLEDERRAVASGYSPCR